jgi:ribonuclease Z
MNFEVTFLGTSAAVPSPSRSHASIALKYFNEILLFDCGEGTQRQLIRSGTSYMKIRKIFITHYHGDHFLGLPGLFQTMALSERTEPLHIYGPNGVEDILDTVLKICRTDLTFDVIPETIKGGEVVKTDIYKVEAVKVDHSTLSFGLVFEEVRGREFQLKKALKLGLKPGPIFSKLKRGEEVKVNGRTIMPEDVLGEKKPCKRLVYSSDTRPTQSITKTSKGAYLIHDSTYDDTLRDQAKEATHSTCLEAAEVAKKGGAKKLFLTHISPRYKDTSILLDQAKAVFKATEVAKDFQRFRPEP